MPERSSATSGPTFGPKFMQKYRLYRCDELTTCRSIVRSKLALENSNKSSYPTVQASFDFIPACHRASARIGRGPEPPAIAARPDRKHAFPSAFERRPAGASFTPQARPHPAGMRDVPGRERRRVRFGGCGPDGGPAPDSHAVSHRAADAESADGADGGGVDGLDADGRRLLLLGQGSARTVRRLRRGIFDNSLHRGGHGDLSGAFRRLSFVHPAARADGPNCDRRRAGVAGGRT